MIPREGYETSNSRHREHQEQVLESIDARKKRDRKKADKQVPERASIGNEQWNKDERTHQRNKGDPYPG